MQENEEHASPPKSRKSASKPVRRLPKVQDPETLEMVSPRKLRQKQVAIESLDPSKTYAEIAAKHYPNAKAGKQTVYSALQNPTAQKVLRQRSKDIDTIKIEILDKISAIYTRAMPKGEKSKSQLQAAVAATQLEAKIHGLLIDKVEQTNKPVSTKDLRDIPVDQLTEALLERVSLPPSLSTNSPNSHEDATTGTITANATSEQGLRE